MYRYDVVVAGAGPAGICAAVEAARSGAKVAVIERYGCVGGNLTIGYVGPLLGGVCAGTMAEEIEARICPAFGLVPDFEKAKIELTAMLEDAGVDVFLQTVVTGADMDGEHLKSVSTHGKFGQLEFAADVFIDATGDGDLAVLCGCPWERGRGGDKLLQPVSLMFVIDGVDPEQKLLCCHEEHYTDLGDGREYLDLCHKACASGELPENVNIVRLYKTGNPGERMVNATQENYIDPLDPMDMAKAERSLRKQIGVVVDFLKNNIPGFADISVRGSASTVGVRESRRITGRYVLTGQDMLLRYPQSRRSRTERGQGRMPHFSSDLRHSLCVHESSRMRKPHHGGTVHLRYPYGTLLLPRHADLHGYGTGSRCGGEDYVRYPYHQCHR